MSELNFIKCCDECWHSPENPCADFVECINSSPKCHNSEKCLINQSDKLNQIRYDNINKTVIFVGAGTCGLGSGAGKTIIAIKNYLKEKNIEADIVEVGCIGLCSIEPIMDIQVPNRTRLSFKFVTEKKVALILDDFFNGKINNEHILGQHRNNNLQEYKGIKFLDELTFFKKQTRWVLANCGIINPTRIEEYIARKGFAALSKVLRSYTPLEVCEIVEKSELRGRGGGGFPSGKKWKLALSQDSKERYLICNADEGDPGAFMDRAVIEGDPYRLIEGMLIVGYAIGASKGYIYIRAEYPLAIERLKISIAKAKDLGFLGKNILDSGFHFDIVIKKGAGAFVCGEETALINSIEGKRGMPKPRPPYPSIKGLFGKPTVINNVETLSNVPKILLNGANWFNSLGTKTSKGTKVFALSGHIQNTGLVEVAMGSTLHDIIYDIGGGIPNGKKFKAVQIGGPSGGCIPSSHLDIDIDYESLKSVGAMMGSGGLVVMNEDSCMVDIAKYFMDFIQRESCGKCIPCREGTRRLLEILERITSNPKNDNPIKKLERFQSVLHIKSLAEVIQDSSLCGLGKSAPNPVLSTLRWFRDEYEAHIYDKKCPAKVCKELLTYRILEDKCTGCTICSKKCPSEAIVGVLKNVHHIITEKCIGCGSCYDACNFNAIVVE